MLTYSVEGVVYAQSLIYILCVYNIHSHLFLHHFCATDGFSFSIQEQAYPELEMDF